MKLSSIAFTESLPNRIEILSHVCFCLLLGLQDNPLLALVYQFWEGPTPVPDAVQREQGTLRPMESHPARRVHEQAAGTCRAQLLTPQYLLAKLALVLGSAEPHAA